MKPINLAPDAPWKLRFRADKIMWATVAQSNPHRGVACTNRSGVLQLHAWDVDSGELKQLTGDPAGVLFGTIAADGRHIYYMEDEGGDEIGHIVRVPFEGGQAEDITPDLPAYACFSAYESGDSSTVALLAARKGIGVGAYVMNKDEAGVLSAPRQLWQTEFMATGLQLSQDGEIMVVASAERSGSMALGLIAINTKSGEIVAEHHEENVSILPYCFSKKAGDSRLLCTSNQSGYARPLIWDAVSGELVDLPMPEVSGELQAWDWSADGEKLLLAGLYKAEYQLYSYELAKKHLKPLEHLGGTVGFFFGGEYTAGGDILVSWQDANHPGSVILLDGETGEQKGVLLAAGSVPDGRPWRSVTFPTVDGTEIQAWLALPEGEGPFPTILHTHGGPTAVMTETFLPESQAWLDHGFAFMTLNYRGSTTFGKAYEEAIWGNLGQVEVEDMAVAREWLVNNGIAMPDAILLTGGSYGGYLTLLGLGREPDLWAGGMATVAVADWRLMYEDQAETLRGYLRGLFQGTPEEKPEAYANSSPVTYVDAVLSPLLVIQGRNDSRCPARQLQSYEEKMRTAGKQIEVEWFDAGHGARADEQQIQHQELKFRFAYRVLG